MCQEAIHRPYPATAHVTLVDDDVETHDNSVWPIKSEKSITILLIDAKTFGTNIVQEKSFGDQLQYSFSSGTNG